MSLPPSTALRELERALAALPSDTPITAGVLSEKLAEAARSTEDWEHDIAMGEDQ